MKYFSYETKLTDVIQPEGCAEPPVRFEIYCGKYHERQNCIAESVDCTAGLVDCTSWPCSWDITVKILGLT